MRPRFLIASLSIMLCTASAVGEPKATDPLALLRASHAAVQQAEHDFRVREAHGQLGPAEWKDYADYLARLRKRLAEDCMVAEAAGINPMPPEIPCAVPVAARPAASSVDPGTAKTHGESSAILDTELGTSLGEFDEMLLREQERIKAATPRSAAGAAGGGSPGGSPGQGKGTDGQSESDSAQAGQEGSTAEAPGAPRAAGKQRADRQPRDGQGGIGATQRRGRKDQPADMPDGSDDDVVARQLREAAEKEQDPELRKKLWEEYRRYKQGTR